jgi:Cu2+-exporting ATPase
MKTVSLHVGDIFTGLDYLVVEKHLRHTPGVVAAVMNPGGDCATVTFDESRTTASALEQAIRDCGFHCRGQALPRHVCGPPEEEQSAHARVPAGPHVHEGHRQAAAAPPAGKPHVHATENDLHDDMGHGAGGDMQAMVRDMRRRFFIALIFAIPVFFYSPMGAMIGPLPLPFGVDRNVFLFVLASGAIIYPGWPFYVAAVRALRRGVFNMAVLVLLSVGTGYVFSIGATFFAMKDCARSHAVGPPSSASSRCCNSLIPDRMR